MKKYIRSNGSKWYKTYFLRVPVAIYGLDKIILMSHFPAEPFNHYGKSKWKQSSFTRMAKKNMRIGILI